MLGKGLWHDLLDCFTFTAFRIGLSMGSSMVEYGKLFCIGRCVDFCRQMVATVDIHLLAACFSGNTCPSEEEMEGKNGSA